MSLSRAYEIVQLGSDIVGTQIDEWFGNSVSLNIDGSVMAIGSRVFDTSFPDAGRVQVFAFRDGDWVQLGSEILGKETNEYFSHTVVLSSNGSVMAVSSHGYHVYTGNM